jgi:hypothetical protein
MALVSDFRHTGCAIRSGLGAVVLTAALAICFAIAMPASASGQNPGSASPNVSSNALKQGATPPAAKSALPASSKHGAHGRSAKTKPAPVVAEIAPLPTPPPPNWPANDKAAPPSVSWNGRNLTIAATNSSLAQILTEVSTATGVKVEGEQSDQRIFGSYGPASARDVLNQLLEGSGYNVLIIGDKGEGTPRELVLTAKGHAASTNSGGNAQARQNADEEAPEPPEQPEQPEQLNNPSNPNNPIQHRPFGMQPGQSRSPEQLQQELQQRQQLQQQLQQPQQQQQNPQPPPND